MWHCRGHMYRNFYPKQNYDREQSFLGPRWGEGTVPKGNPGNFVVEEGCRCSLSWWQWVYYVVYLSQFSSVAQSYLTLCDPMNCSMPGLLVHHQLPEFIQTHAHRINDAIQPSHPLPSPSPPALNPSQHQGLFQWVNSSHEVAKVLDINISPSNEHPGLISFRMD